jgi:hypothetical protein
VIDVSRGGRSAATARASLFSASQLCRAIPKERSDILLVWSREDAVSPTIISSARLSSCDEADPRCGNSRGSIEHGPLPWRCPVLCDSAAARSTFYVTLVTDRRTSMSTVLPVGVLARRALASSTRSNSSDRCSRGIRIELVVLAHEHAHGPSPSHIHLVPLGRYATRRRRYLRCAE